MSSAGIDRVTWGCETSENITNSYISVSYYVAMLSREYIFVQTVIMNCITQNNNSSTQTNWIWLLQPFKPPRPIVCYFLKRKDKQNFYFISTSKSVLDYSSLDVLALMTTDSKDSLEDWFWMNNSIQKILIYSKNKSMHSGC